MGESKNWSAAARLVTESAGRDAIQNFFKNNMPPGMLAVLHVAMAKYAAAGKVPSNQAKDLNDLIEIVREARGKLTQDPASKKWSVQEPKDSE